MAREKEIARKLAADATIVFGRDVHPNREDDVLFDAYYMAAASVAKTKGVSIINAAASDIRTLLASVGYRVAA